MIEWLIEKTREMQGSDLHLTCGEPPIVRQNGKLVRLTDQPVMTESAMDAMVDQLTRGTDIVIDRENTDFDFCYVSAAGERQRVNIFRQQGHKAVVLRMLNAVTPTFAQLGLPGIFKEIASFPRGLVLVTGPTGSGKTTTLAAMVDFINSTKSDHILTVEDPIEYVHTGKRCVINQRELGEDVCSFSAALRSALREDPDMILVGEMRDLDTISAALTAAETGHFVMSTLHTVGAAKTIDRVIDVFPPHQQQQIRIQLATVLRAVITQTLIPKKDGSGRVAAFEIMIVNDAIANLIREGKTFQMNSVMQTGAKSGMILLDMYLATLLKQGLISLDEAREHCVNRAELERFANG